MLSGPAAEKVGPSTPPPRQLTAVTFALERLVSRNDRLLSEDHHRNSYHSLPVPAALDAFRAARPPTISIEKYLGRIYKYTGCSPSCFVVAFVYLDRLLHRYPGALVVSLNVHRLVLTGVLVASKVLDDVNEDDTTVLYDRRHHDNAFYARVGGVSNAELNRLELELLSGLDFSVMVGSRVFECYCCQLEKEMTKTEAMQKMNLQSAIAVYDCKAKA